ncbi:MAG: hypothetical protein AABW67_00015 [Nanoarchaeota archaeon]|mgnify:CR=1 FL=1
MGDYEENIPLTKEDVTKIKEILKNKKFEEFKIHPYFYRDKFTNTFGNEPRHNIDLSELKKIHEKSELIKRGFKREGERGNKYTLCYEESTNVFVKIGYLLDEIPPKIFQAMRIFRNLERAVPRRYEVSI